jgi:hypothetical protein
MRTFFSNPNRLWAIIFVIASLVVLGVTYNAYYTYWNNTIYRVQTVDFNILHATLPYALAFLEEHHRLDLIQPILNTNYGLFGIAYIDSKDKNKILFKTSTSRDRFPPITPQVLSQNACSWVYRTPRKIQISCPNPFEVGFFERPINSSPKGESYGGVILVRPDPPTYWHTLTSVWQWSRLLPGGDPPSDYFLMTIVAGLISLFLLFCFALYGRSLSWKLKRLEEREHARLQGEIERLREESAIQQANLGLIRQRMEQVERERDRLAKERRDLESLAEEAEREATEHRNRIGSLQEQHLELQGEIERLREESAIQQANLGLIRQRMEQVERERDRLAKESARDPLLSNLRSWLPQQFPNLEFSTQAERELSRLLRRTSSHHNIWRVLSCLEVHPFSTQPIPLDKGPVLKMEHWKSRPGFWEVRLGDDRIYLTTGKKKKYHIVFILAPKTRSGEKEAERYINQYQHHLRV